MTDYIDISTWTISLTCCGRCGALIHNSAQIRDLHDEWHDSLPHRFVTRDEASASGLHNEVDRLFGGTDGN